MAQTNNRLAGRAVSATRSGFPAHPARAIRASAVPPLALARRQAP
ncbi:hypothetical protein HMPREF3150_04715 [Pseudomonas aeruginosa]|nr:hypothetical protein HMPREF3150_04715 [Pseudomonas aeruginosa]